MTNIGLSQFPAVDLLHLERLYLGKNRIDAGTLSSLSFPRLQVLDLSSNNLIIVPGW